MQRWGVWPRTYSKLATTVLPVSNWCQYVICVVVVVGLPLFGLFAILKSTINSVPVPTLVNYYNIFLHVYASWFKTHANSAPSQLCTLVFESWKTKFGRVGCHDNPKNDWTSLKSIFVRYLGTQFQFFWMFRQLWSSLMDVFFSVFSSSGVNLTYCCYAQSCQISFFNSQKPKCKTNFLEEQTVPQGFQRPQYIVLL